ncbi:MAG TPA: hypothetical protein ENI17_05970 [Pseudomonas xinjiangensis]|uniref:Uncharacterized protein n=2 Tax=root TaxID=1 RepID=A0A7V1BLD3_9GAMM|nr:hypothetical protein [Halopseudomonas xinjiangensis]HEC47159.1 hypothetical protein [Halopseudomonas xinjiangensis]
MELKALREFRYAGKLLQPGGLFTATERDAKILCLIGRASPEPATPDSEAQPAPPEIKQEERANSRTYKRRDMTVE